MKREQSVIDHIPYFPNTPISRERLAQVTGLSDRAIRSEIQSAKMMFPIVNVGGGYYIATEPDDPNLVLYIRQEMHRIREISRGLKTHKALNRIDTQQQKI